MTVFSLCCADQRNAVSELHAKVSRRMWRELFGAQKEEDVPIASVTKPLLFTQTPSGGSSRRNAAADVALLKGETRSLAQKGIQKLRETNRLGLKVIAELSGTSLETLTEETIGFTFAPRLNALGRLGDANPAVELLLTSDPPRARVLAAQIEGLNAQRRLLTSQVYEAAEAQLRANPDLLTEPVIVLSNRGWPGGVVGIVANKLVDRYHKPAILLNESEDGVMRGSARSIEGLHITDAIATQKELLRSFGGHPMAAGMAFDADKLAEFRRGLGKAIEKQLGEIVFEEPTLQIDAWLGLDELNISLAESLEMLAPA
jgi:single-stranded-DNA-specific exonuclease